MRLAFCLFKYFPYGGLQRDFMRIAQKCYEKGHEIVVYTMSWEGVQPQHFTINIINCNQITNHAKITSFTKKVGDSLIIDKVDLVIGFNKMPGLDIYYCADTCYVAKVEEQKKNLSKLFYKLTNRYKTYSKLEHEIFNNTTKVLYISKNEQNIYNSIYKHKSNLNYLLPPNINKQRFIPELDVDKKLEIKHRLAKELGLDYKKNWLLMVGSGFKTKGLDRSIHLLRYLKDKKVNASLIVIGQDNPSKFNRLAKKLGVTEDLRVISGREDIRDFMTVSALLVHPAYRENTGTVILEAIIMGLPAVVSGTCGYSHYVEEAKCGMVTREPFSQSEFNTSVLGLLGNNDLLNAMTESGLKFRESADIYSADETILGVIENA